MSQLRILRFIETRSTSRTPSLSFRNDGGWPNHPTDAIKRPFWGGDMVPMNALVNGISLDVDAELRLAIMELKMLLAAVVLHFDVEWADDCQDPLADIWSQVDPVHLRLRRRAVSE